MTGARCETSWTPMDLPDVNVLVAAHRADAPAHAPCLAWLDAVTNGPAPFGSSDYVLSSFVRLVTNRRIFKTPTPLDEALAFAAAVRSNPHSMNLVPGPSHWEMFERLCREINAQGNVVPDAYLAALAMEHRWVWGTADTGFTRFRGLSLKNPAWPT